ncbi:hypothetical protein CLV59_10682 [Chitinophaga dinghuensis]|uniref:Uncharacterized protein n=1 Tax=Chitinophaga dinghuensis TaxID=1539050 RepID=A0A327VU59_9BACT|nr:hypothetical protein [Chitinophaga dinghuensis]RAJ79022.1 hypothetical protein CLV59_10682 [Chitinophaga dinghuensis]
MDKGKLIQEYRPSKAMWGVYGLLIGFFVLLAICGIVLNFVLPGAEFAGKFIFVFCLVIAILFYVSAKKKMNIPTYLLYENGVEREYKSQTYFMPLAGLHDLFLFTTGKSPAPNNLAFKSAGSDIWELINIHHGGDLAALININAQKRSDYLLQQLKEGETIQFNYITTATALKNSFTALSTQTFLQSQSKQLGLNSKYLTVDGTSFPLTSLEPIQHSPLKGYFIKTTDGKEVFSFRETTLWSFMVFLILFGTLTKEKATA